MIRVRSNIGVMPKPLRLLFSAVSVGLLLSAGPSSVAWPAEAHHQRLPRTYVVSTTPGVLPEGVAVGPGGTLYVTSLGTGAVYRGDLQHRRLSVFSPGGAAGRRSAAGVHVDAAGRVYVAAPKALYVYSPSGRLLARRPAPSGAVGEPSLNDLVITDRAVYVTDFTNPVVLRAKRHDGGLGQLRPWRTVTDVNPDLPARYWYLNGITASSHGRTLLVSSQGLGSVLRLDVRTRAAELVDLGGLPFGPDGMQLRGTRLYAVLNYAAPVGQGVYVAKLDPALRQGRVVGANTGRFDSPTTLALTGRRVLVVNSQLDHSPGRPPYTVTAVRVPIHRSALSGTAMRASTQPGPIR